MSLITVFGITLAYLWAFLTRPAFATDSNVGGYPKGARIMRSDGLGYWFNTVENNTTDPVAAPVVKDHK